MPYPEVLDKGFRIVEVRKEVFVFRSLKFFPLVVNSQSPFQTFSDDILFNDKVALNNTGLILPVVRQMNPQIF